MSKKAASRVRRIPLADADIGKLARRMHQNGEYFIVEDRGVPMVGLMDAEEMEDYLELRDPAVRRAIRKSTREYSRVAHRGRFGMHRAVTWRTASGKVVVVRGTLRLKMEDHPAAVPGPGDFLFLPAWHIDRTSARRRAHSTQQWTQRLDIHRAAPSRNEIAADVALKSNANRTRQ